MSSWRPIANAMTARKTSWSIPAFVSGALRPEALNGTDRLEIFVCANGAYDHAVLVARLDNLGKGASGAAVQNIKLMLGGAVDA